MGLIERGDPNHNNFLKFRGGLAVVHTNGTNVPRAEIEHFDFSVTAVNGDSDHVEGTTDADYAKRIIAAARASVAEVTNELPFLHLSLWPVESQRFDGWSYGLPVAVLVVGYYLKMSELELKRCMRGIIMTGQVNADGTVKRVDYVQEKAAKVMAEVVTARESGQQTRSRSRFECFVYPRENVSPASPEKADGVTLFPVGTVLEAACIAFPLFDRLLRSQRTVKQLRDQMHRRELVAKRTRRSFGFAIGFLCVFVCVVASRPWWTGPLDDAVKRLGYPAVTAGKSIAITSPRKGEQVARSIKVEGTASVKATNNMVRITVIPSGGGAEDQEPKEGVPVLSGKWIFDSCTIGDPDDESKNSFEIRATLFNERGKPMDFDYVLVKRNMGRR